MLIKQIKIAMTRRKIKRHKKEIELLNYYNEHRDTCSILSSLKKHMIMIIIG